MRQLLVAVIVVSVLASGALAGRWKKSWKRQRGCRRAAGEGVTEEGEGKRFMWTMSGLDDDDLLVTYMEGAYAPDGATTVFKYPRDRGQRALGLVPAKIVYDYSTPDPVAVIRQGRRGRGSCILVEPDVDTYEDLINMLLTKNLSNGNVPEREESIRLVATEVSDDSQFSQVVRDICSKSQCGLPIEPVYYTTELVTDEEDDEQLDETAEILSEPSFVLLNTRLTISGLPDPRQERMRRRQNRRQHAHRPGRWQRRQRGRQWRRQGARRDMQRNGRIGVQSGL